MKKTLCFGVIAFFLSSYAVGAHVEQKKTPSWPFQHDGFEVIVPPDWKAVYFGFPGMEISFVPDNIPNTNWYVHYEVMPAYISDPSHDPAKIEAMADQLINLVQQQFPGAKNLFPPIRNLPATPLIHLLYQTSEYGGVYLREYIYFWLKGTAYVIRANMPAGRSRQLKPAFDLLFSSFHPKPQMPSAPTSAEQALRKMKNNLPVLAVSMPSNWRPDIDEVRFVPDGSDSNELSVEIRTTWHRRRLMDEFGVVKQSFSLSPNPLNIPSATLEAAYELFYYVGQLLGMACNYVYQIEPKVSSIKVSIFDSSSNRVGTIGISTGDLIKIITQEVTWMDAVRMYEIK